MLSVAALLDLRHDTLGCGVAPALANSAYLSRGAPQARATSQRAVDAAAESYAAGNLHPFIASIPTTGSFVEAILIGRAQRKWIRRGRRPAVTAGYPA